MTSSSSENTIPVCSITVFDHKSDSCINHFVEANANKRHPMVDQFNCTSQMCVKKSNHDFKSMTTACELFLLLANSCYENINKCSCTSLTTEEHKFLMNIKSSLNCVMDGLPVLMALSTKAKLSHQSKQASDRFEHKLEQFSSSHDKVVEDTDSDEEEDDDDLDGNSSRKKLKRVTNEREPCPVFYPKCDNHIKHM